MSSHPPSIVNAAASLLRAAAEPLQNVSPDELLQRLIAKLETGSALSLHEQRLTAQFLKRLKEGGTVRSAAQVQPRPQVLQPAPVATSQLIAIDYAAQKERHGRGGEARRIVAEAWSRLLGTRIKRGAVMQAFVTHRDFAETFVARHLATHSNDSAENLGGRAAEASREALLDALSLEVRKRPTKVGR